MKKTIFAVLLFSWLPVSAALNPSPGEAWRINCGAETWDYTDPRGNWWMKDEAFTTQYRWGHTGGQGAQPEVPIANTDMPDVYRTHRWGPAGLGYQVEVPTGSYTVTLHFAETYWDGPGKRSFDVDVERVRVATRLDVFAAAGGKNRAYRLTTTVPVSDGILNIDFPYVQVDQAMVSGIEITLNNFNAQHFSQFLSKKLFWMFWNESDPDTGLVADQAWSFAPGRHPKTSIAATGFGLSAITVAAKNGWITPQMARERIATTLNFFENEAEHFHGFWYHFIDERTNKRWIDPANPADRSEVSTVDSALLIMGALQAGEYFRTTYPEIAAQADRLYRRMEWRHFTGRGNGDTFQDKFVSMGWTPEDGFIRVYWNSYSESVFVNLLALGSPDHAISPDAWTYMARYWKTQHGYDHMQFPSLFVHQYHHLYFDLRNKHDDFGDYAKNTEWATQVNRLTCLADGRYSQDRWGVSAAYGADGNYHIYGTDNLDGTVTPTAAGGSFDSTYSESLAALRHMFFQYKHWIWGRHGFTDSFNVAAGGVADRTLGLDNGPILLAIENRLSGMVRETFMRNAHVQRGMAAAGLRPYTAPYAYASTVLNGNLARFAVDGSTATRWESSWPDPQFLAMDFITPKQVNRVSILWETARAKAYAVQYSNDGTHWTDAHSTLASDGGQDVVRFAPVTARYFRIQGRERAPVNGATWGYSIWECAFEFDPQQLAAGPAAADGTLKAVFDAAGVLHATYYDASKRGLRYARWTGAAWSAPELIDAAAAGYPSDDGAQVFLNAQDLAVDAAGRPHVIYYADAGKLYYAYKDGAWKKEFVAAVDHSVVPSLAVDAAGGAHAAFSSAAGAGTLYYARRGPNGWATAAVGGAAPANVSQLTLDAAGKPHLVYATKDPPRELFYTRRENAGWTAPERADSMETWRHRVAPTLLIDGDGKPRVLDVLNNRDGRVRYSVRGAGGWSSEYAHYDAPDWDHTGTPEPGFVLDGAGAPRALYVMHSHYTPYHTRTTVAARVGSGWQENLLAEDDRFGVGAALAIDAAGRIHTLTLGNDGRLRLLRLTAAVPAPVGGGRNALAQGPSQFAGTATATSMVWTWRDNAVNESGYRIYGATTAGGPFALLAALPANARSYSEPAGPVGTIFYRYVAAWNPAGHAVSGVTALQRPLPPPTALALSGGSAPTLVWSANGNPTGTLYQAFRSVDNVLYTQFYSGTALSAPAPLPGGKTHHFRARAQRGTQFSPFSAVVSTTTPASLSAPGLVPPGEAPPVSARYEFAAGEAFILFSAEDPAPPSADRLLGAWRVAASADGAGAILLSPSARHSRLGRWDGAKWLPLPAPGRLDGETVVGLFAGASPAATGGTRIFPNPFRAARGHAVITVAGAPGGARLRLFTALGEPVRELILDATGSASFDGRNADGRPLASGVYVAILESGGTQKILRLAVLQ